MTALRVAFAGGGTGGHVYPALAIHDAFEARGGAYEPRYFGNADGLERGIVDGRMPFAVVPSAPLARKNLLGVLSTAFVNAAGVLAALRGLVAFRPHAVVATGGYVCFPVVVAARILRALRIARPTIGLLEINAQPGLTNRLLAPLVDEVWTTFASTNARFGAKAFRTGAPVREAFLRLPSRAEARRLLGLDPATTVILAIGGSQGARTLNAAISAIVTAPDFPDTWEVVHLTGRRDYDAVAAAQAGAPARAHARPYLDDPSAAFAAADVVVARSGASTTAELAASGRPAVFVPYPYAADDHQLRNAQAVMAAGAAIIVLDSELTGETLRRALETVLLPERRSAMAAAATGLGVPDAARRIVDRIATRAGKG